MLTTRTFNIAIIEDDQLMREMLTDYLNTHFSGTLVTHYATGEQALSNNLNEQHLILLDFHLSSNNPQSKNGLQVLKELCNTYFDLPVIVLSAQENRKVAMDIIKHGAWDYIIKNEMAFDRLGMEVSKLLDRTDFVKHRAARTRIVRASIVIASVAFITLLVMKFM